MTYYAPIPDQIAPQPTQVQVPTFDARDLVGTQGQSHIVLDGAQYVLRITRAGKLILTK